MQLIFTTAAKEIILENLTDFYKTSGIKMKDFYPFMMIIIIMVLLPFSTFADNGSDSGEPIIYSNSELEEYKKSSDNKRTVNTTVSQKRNKFKSSSAKKPKRDEEHLKKYWCSKGTQFRKKTDKARDEYAEAKNNFSDKETLYFYKKISLSRYNATKTKLEHSEKNLKEAEKNLNDIENEAHQDWIPPGRLRCQF